LGAVAITIAAQQSALIDLYVATDGASWSSSDSGWKDYLTGSDPCNDVWDYVTCDGSAASSSTRAV
jgi:hypothetical protein